MPRRKQDSGRELVPLVYTVQEVLASLNLSRNSVLKLLKNGELSSQKFGRKWLVPREAVQTFLHRHAEGQDE
ncbi:helix-turn-helix domain-containing protein [Deinococcus soli (ex Cha et al. 2016)]|uniref:Excisionase family DNA binding protein n=2 Tax=Deinococcus soli (ex Cha et al. 2016) TaxID=1309411 RepID=A0ACC6KHZ5_9DEIO|nr:helix-turn-helix domain-containing protein [Deinococcus soli (ex Cha et al. 2016)]MDR6219212.1 excisionase family DNA binding protein [Deinococcus soli (ex Cha et al. 2016)]MDR6329461.1 excisionase family DNA binding protein [Deinococcus soli (ex Cha et al. 2016)]MDR6752121.1 excisionase family DNA binding protein [Deinococcus soli (ex Cha et al. 2016)]